MRPEAREAFSWLAAAVSVATTGPAGAVHGTTLSSVVSLAVDPPILGFVSRAGGRLAAAVKSGDPFGITVLARGQDPIAARCAEPGRDAMDERALERPFGAVPVVRGGIARFAVRSIHRFVLGRSLFVIAAVESVDAPGGEPLLYHRRRYAALRHGDAP